MKLTKLTKGALYEVIKEEGFILPKFTSTACRLPYLVSIRAGTEYCPRTDEVQGVYCENPPKRTVMLQIIYDELQRRGDSRTLTFDEKHVPDVDWCLSAISALDPLHPIFEPGYLPSNEQRGRRGRKYVPDAEELVYMIDFQSAAQAQAQAQAQASTAASQKKSHLQSSSNTFGKSTQQTDNTQCYYEVHKDDQMETLSKLDIQSGTGKHKNPPSGTKEQMQYNYRTYNAMQQIPPFESGTQGTSFKRTPQFLKCNFNSNFTDTQSQLNSQKQVNEKGLDNSQEQLGNHSQNNLKSPVAQRSNGPLLNMLRKLESRGLLNECMTDYIKIQQEYENQQSSSHYNDKTDQSPKLMKPSLESEMLKEIRSQYTKAYTANSVAKKGPNFNSQSRKESSGIQSYTFVNECLANEESDLNQQPTNSYPRDSKPRTFKKYPGYKQGYQDGFANQKFEAPHLKEDDIREELKHAHNQEDLFNQNVQTSNMQKGRSFKIAENANQNHSGTSKVIANALTMNQLMDESHVNPSEYEEVAFQDLVEENENHDENESSTLQMQSTYHQQKGEMDNQKSPQKPEEEDLHEKVQMSPVIHIV